MIGQKIKNYSSFTFLPENLEKYRSTELYDAPLEGSMQFQHDWPKDKNITAVLFFWPENLHKLRSTELYDAPQEGSTIFL